MDLKLRPKEECKFDEISLGEIMLRLDPGEGRIKTSRTFRAWEGGGEYNVARGLRRCFGMRTGVVTAFAENEVGYLLEDLILQGGVDTSLIRWVPFDGIGRSVRNGLNFVERGYGIRGAVSTSDRGNTAISQLKPGDVDWDYIFGTLGVRWLHTGGIYAALSENSAAVVLEGGSGRATVDSPAALTVAEGKMTATIVWSSPNYDYMIVDGEKYLPTNTEGNSTFEIPVAALGTPLAVTADTVAMSTPHEIEYTLTFTLE